MLEDAVSILGISMTYVLNKSLEMKKRDCLALYAPWQPCVHKCDECEVDSKFGCIECKRVGDECTPCAKNKPYELLKPRMVGGPSTIFYQYHETGKSRIQSHKYQNPKTCTSIVGFDANFLYLYCASQVTPTSSNETNFMER